MISVIKIYQRKLIIPGNPQQNCMAETEIDKNLSPELDLFGNLAATKAMRAMPSRRTKPKPKPKHKPGRVEKPHKRHCQAWPSISGLVMRARS